MNDCGIYRIINIEDNKIYVGSSHRLRKRKYEHFKYLADNKHCSTYLQNAYNKYGKDNFKWEIIEYIEFNEDKELLKEILVGREQYWMDELKKTYELYNLCPTAYSRLGTKDSYETIRKRALANTGKKRTKAFSDRMSRMRKGRVRGNYPQRVFSEEHIKNLSDSHKGNKMSEEVRQRLIEYHKNRPKEIQDRMNRNHMKKVINLDTGVVFNSILEASEFYGLNRHHISSVCNGNRKTTGGYRWSFFKKKNQIKKVCYNSKAVINMETGLIFPSVMEASGFYGIPFSSIARVCRGERKTTGGYRWYYL